MRKNMDSNVFQSNNNFTMPPGLDSLMPIARHVPGNRRNNRNNNNNNNNSNDTQPHAQQSTVPASGARMEETSLSGEIQTPSNVYNLTNANDVVIGPMTQYRGPVTIYQHLDANFETSRLAGGPNVSLQNSAQQNENSIAFGSQRISNWVLLLASLIIAAGLGFGIFFALHNNQPNTNSDSSRPPREILFGNGYDEDGALIHLGNDTNVFPRNQWGGQESKITEKTFTLHHPIPYVMITHIGVQSVPCDKFYECSVQMRTIQDAAKVEQNLIDLPANFYSGFDGYIYFGRGWNQTNAYNNISLAICLIGDYIRYVPGQKQLDAVQLLIKYGVDHKIIAEDYKLIAHNQTKSTGSPGTNAYSEIVNWPHWHSCSYRNTSNICGSEFGLKNIDWNGQN